MTFINKEMGKNKTKIAVRIRTDNAFFAIEELNQLFGEKPLRTENKIAVYNATKENISNIKKAGYSKKSWIVLAESQSKKEILEKTKNVHKEHFKGYKTFKVETETYGKKEGAPIKKDIANIVLDKTNISVNVTEPNLQLTYLVSDKHYLCVDQWTRNKRINERRPDRLPRPHPTGVHPLLSRAMVNIVKAENKILDPFCGAGGILLEAATLGLESEGYDIDSRMIDRAKENTQKYKDKINLEKTNCFEKSFKDAYIVTDIPYGRNSTIKENTYRLFEKFIQKTMRERAKKVCVMYPKTPTSCKIMNKVEHKSFDFPVNKSLTRRMSVYHPS